MTGELTRRSALRGTGIFAAGAAAGVVVTGLRDDGGDNPNANAYGDDTSTGSGSALAAVDDIPSGGGLVLDDADVVLTKADDGTVRGFSSICTHQGCVVSEVADGRIICPCHGSQFDADSGEVTDGPASRPLPSVAVAVRDGEVFPG